MACPICGKDCRNYTPQAGGVTVTRLKGKGENMGMVTLSKDRWYVTADKTRKVAPGSPEAAYLLVGKDGAIAPEVAAHYGIETYTGESVSSVPHNRADEKTRMVTEGSSRETALNYEEMSLNRDVREMVNSGITREAENRSAGRQAEMMAQAIIADIKNPETPSTFPGMKEDAPPPGLAKRTKEVAPEDSTGTAALHDSPPANKGETGQDPESMAKSLQELDDAKDKTL